jgi:hypothetical protein
VLVAVLLLTGCAAGGGDPEPTPTRSAPSAEGTPTTPPPDPADPPATPATPTTAPTGEPPADLTCDSLRSEKERSHPLPEGMVLLEDYQQKLEQESSPLRLFFEFGGLACLWGFEGTDNVDVRAYSQLDEDQAAGARAELESLGFEPMAEGSDTVYRQPAGNELGFDEAYVFTPDAWYYGLTQVSRDVVRAELVD